MYKEDILEIHPSDAELRGINDGDRVSLASRKGDITLCAQITERVQPGRNDPRVLNCGHSD